ncbi:MAG: T9SS type A sorting domain-containing protein [Bacteroidetes bacterium]|nr:T9SS type A sorting domain-containing protein [Bacteroidota bacterium]
MSEQTSVLPEIYSLSDNYPNPFNPVTTINYKLPKDSEVNMVIYNMMGQKVRTLVSGQIKAGSYNVTWDGLNEASVQVPSGVYINHLRAGDYNKIQKMILLR